MARIPEAEIERLKAEISLERLAEARGVKLKRHGADLMGLCPFHDDRTPSLVISPEKNLWHCLGACQAGGTVIDWVMRAEGVSFRHAVELLREGLPSLVAAPVQASTRSKPRAGKVVKHSSVKKLGGELERSAGDDELLERVVAYYQESLKESPEALEYLAARGLSAELVTQFRLGFSNRTLGYRLPDKNRSAGAELRGRLERLGVFRESGHEHFNGSLVVPIFDEAGRVTEMYGRKVTAKLRPGTPLHLYLPGAHRGVWNLQAFQASREIILCEALIDAMTFWSAGFRNVTAAYGVEGFIEDHRAALRQYGTERVYIAYDRDEAGDRAAVKLADELAAMGIEVLRVKFPKGMDANEFALKVQPAAQSLGLVLRQAEWMAGVRGKAVAMPVPASAANEAEPPLVSPPSDEVAEAEVLTDEVATAELEPAAPTPELLAAAPAPEPISALAATEPLAVAEPSVPRMTAREILHLAADLGDAVADNVPPPSADRAAAPSTAPSSAALPHPDEASWVFGDRRWRARGLSKALTPGALKVNLFVSRESGSFHVDTVELYSARQRAAYLKQASEELGVEERILKKDLGEVLLRLEERQEQQLKQEKAEKKAVELTEEDQRAALELLSNPKLLDRLLRDFERCGVVGEETNKLVGYLAATSRKLDQPLAVIIQSSSAAGKSSLMDAVLSLMPEEERVEYSAMTGQSLFYMGEADLKHKILAIVEEEGAERASYALKLLQSEGELTIASTGKDPATGRLVTQEYRVEGPVMIFLTTTAIEVDDELLNRCLVLTVDEGRDQTRKIHELQREAQTLEGLLAKRERERIVRLYQNAQRLIRPLFVANPFARELTFLDHQTRTRRDHMKYLTLIRAIALLHQYQRPVKTAEHLGEAIRYIEVTREDIATAHRLAHEVLGRSLDELPPQTRRLLNLIDELVAEGAQKLGVDRSDFRFSRRQVRERTGWGDTQLRVHLGRLVELELVLAHRGRQGQSFLYELLAQTGASGPYMSGLLDAEALSGGTGTMATSRGSGVTPRGDDGDFAGGVRGASGPEAGGVRGAERRLNQQNNVSIRDRATKPSPNTPIRGRDSASVVALPTVARDTAPAMATASARS
jgi:DNA primase